MGPVLLQPLCPYEIGPETQYVRAIPKLCIVIYKVHMTSIPPCLPTHTSLSLVPEYTKFPFWLSPNQCSDGSGLLSTLKTLFLIFLAVYIAPPQCSTITKTAFPNHCLQELY